MIQTHSREKKVSIAKGRRTRLEKKSRKGESREKERKNDTR